MNNIVLDYLAMCRFPMCLHPMCTDINIKILAILVMSKQNLCPEYILLIAEVKRRKYRLCSKLFKKINK